MGTCVRYWGKVGPMDGIELLAEGNDALASLDLSGLADSELGEMLVALQREHARFMANKTRVMGEFDARRAYADDGSKTAAAWMARATRCAPSDARALARHGRRLPHMPATRAALAAGLISDRHAAVLGSLYASARKPVADAFGEAEEMLVGYAKDLFFDDFLAAVRYWENLVDADGAEDQAASDYAARRFHMSEIWRGNWALDGQLDPISGEEVFAELSRREQELFQSTGTRPRPSTARTPASTTSPARPPNAGPMHSSRWPGARPRSPLTRSSPGPSSSPTSATITEPDVRTRLRHRHHTRTADSAARQGRHPTDRLRRQITAHHRPRRTHPILHRTTT